MEIKETRFVSPIKQPIFVLQPPPPPPPPPSSSGFNLNDKVSPSILMIIIILAIIFFISGLLHLLVRFLLRPPRRRDHDEIDDVTVLQGQLQQLFHLHDAGVDQSYIDTLPVFNYKSIIGLNKSPFDCAVCLSEFEPEDKLRLLPKCSHAFHMECIDTWLLSHSTCPLCRASLLNDFSTPHHNNLSHVVLVLESGSESSREILPENSTTTTTTTNISGNSRTNSQIRAHWDNTDSRVPLSDLFQKSGEINHKEDKNPQFLVGSGEKVVEVKLGKFRNVNGGGRTGECSSENNVDERRCFSMGSFAYIMDENSSLQVPIRTPIKKKKTPCNNKPCHRAAMSECGWDSRREIIGFEGFRSIENQENGKIMSATKSNEIGAADDKASKGSSGKGESFSISKIWLRGKEDKQSNLVAGQTSRRSFSFRLPF